MKSISFTPCLCLIILPLTPPGKSITIVNVSGSLLDNKLVRIINEVLDVDALKIGAETRAGDALQWDSLNCVRIMLAIESEYKIRFALREIEDVHSLQDLFNLLELKIARQ
jgi:acyl carrier protein